MAIVNSGLFYANFNSNDVLITPILHPNVSATIGGKTHGTAQIEHQMAGENHFLAAGGLYQLFELKKKSSFHGT